jgi:NADH-quinone oxidoreductase subunit J
LNKKAFAAVAVFFLVIFGTLLRSITNFSEVVQNVSGIATDFYSTYVVAFELLSLILVGGIIGMFYITSREED